MHQPISFAVLACGARGRGASDWIYRNPHLAKLVAVADPISEHRDLIADRHGIPQPMRFDSWESLLAEPRLADAVLNTTMDPLHAPSALVALERGYHMLLEKPMATTLEECVAIDQARKRSDRIVSVCHSLRYHSVYREIKRLITSGVIGSVVSIDQLEAVEPVHQSHSFVRGNWGNEARSTFMLMGKSCHDVDVLVYLVGHNVKRVSSFGRLSHFAKANQPPGAPHRCTDGCPHETACPYSSLKVYVDGDWGDLIGLAGKTREQRLDFARSSKYGICVYDTDNDVVDHQVASFEFTDGATGTFTMTAFAQGGRQLRVHGTHGEIHSIVGQMKIRLRTFWDPQREQEYTLPQQAGSHGGGDDNVLETFVRAIQTDDPSIILSGTDVSLQTHAATFAAERARKEGRVVSLAELLPNMQ